MVGRSVGKRSLAVRRAHRGLPGCQLDMGCPRVAADALGIAAGVQTARRAWLLADAAADKKARAHAVGQINVERLRLTGFFASGAGARWDQDLPRTRG